MRRLPSEPVYLMNKRIQREGYKLINKRAKLAVIEICIIALTLVVLFFSTNPFIDNFKYRTNGINCEFRCPDFNNGNTVFFENGGENFIIDSGNGNHGKELISFLTSEEIDTVNYLFISELNDEYLQSLDIIINSVTVHKIILLSTDNEQMQKMFIDYIATTPVLSQNANKGMSFRIGKSTVDVTDASSLSIRLSFGKNKFLILNSGYEHEDIISDVDVMMIKQDYAIEVFDKESNEKFRTDVDGDIILKSNEIDIKIECKNR